MRASIHGCMSTETTTPTKYHLPTPPNTTHPPLPPSYITTHPTIYHPTTPTLYQPPPHPIPLTYPTLYHPPTCPYPIPPTQTYPIKPTHPHLKTTNPPLGYCLLLFDRKYNGMLIKSHKSRGGRLRV